MIRYGVILGVIGIFGGLPAVAAASPSPTASYWVVNDVYELMLVGPSSLIRNPQFPMAVATIGGLMLVDRSTTAYYEASIKPVFQPYSVSEWSPDGNLDNALFEFIKASYGYAEQNDDDSLRRFAYSAGEAVLDAWVISQGTKLITGRLRPNHTDDPYQWGHRSTSASGAGTSFFSGHATAYMAFFTVVGKYTEQETLWDVTGVAAYMILLSSHNHWVSDMVAGYFVGKAIGNYVWDRNQNRVLKGEWFIYPTFVPGEGAYLIKIGATKTF